jgi:heme A synthase
MNNVLQRLKIPAIGLIVVAGLDLLIGILTVISGLARLAGVMGKEPRIRDDAERLGYLLGTGVG